jgi:predicted transcriptional regulator of viral defense system
MDKKQLADILFTKTEDIGRRNKCVVECIVNYSDCQGFIPLSIRDIHKTVGKSLSTVHAVVKKLIEAGHVEMISSGVYRIAYRPDGNDKLIERCERKCAYALKGQAGSCQTPQA